MHGGPGHENLHRRLHTRRLDDASLCRASRHCIRRSLRGAARRRHARLAAALGVHVAAFGTAAGLQRRLGIALGGRTLRARGEGCPRRRLRLRALVRGHRREARRRNRPLGMRKDDVAGRAVRAGAARRPRRRPSRRRVVVVSALAPLCGLCAATRGLGRDAHCPREPSVCRRPPASRPLGDRAGRPRALGHSAVAARESRGVAGRRRQCEGCLWRGAPPHGDRHGAARGARDHGAGRADDGLGRCRRAVIGPVASQLGRGGPVAPVQLAPAAPRVDEALPRTHRVAWRGDRAAARC
mmetsp:Transcript_77726/g.224712  ORF Transcript_77726/g.224712 Transcript_77726/m.224712 type:complete len:297 (+) Transcript_77726:1106-1996(+)